MSVLRVAADSYGLLGSLADGLFVYLSHVLTNLFVKVFVQNRIVSFVPELGFSFIHPNHDWSLGIDL